MIILFLTSSSLSSESNSKSLLFSQLIIRSSILNVDHAALSSTDCVVYLYRNIIICLPHIYHSNKYHD